VRTGGVLEDAKIGSDELVNEQLDADIERLVRVSERLAESPR
jgi:hypothetical protein